MTREDSLGIVRHLMNRGIPEDAAINNEVIPAEHRAWIREQLRQEQLIVLEPANIILRNRDRHEWLRNLDRSNWSYWPSYREYLFAVKHWTRPSVTSLDEVTDTIVAQLAPPDTEEFDIRGLVLGFVQSGKTANFTALIAKAADIGYRLIIVLSGIDNGLRRQTQIRLKKELVGYSDNRPDSVRLPPIGKRWHEFTSDDIDGDFRPGNANHAALQGTQPVLLVIKKNSPVLRRLIGWLDQAPQEVFSSLPMLLVDDEADQASVDTAGSYQSDDEEIPEDYEEPSTINQLIRQLLSRFRRKAYVAYTATPFANILIPHDTYDPRVENDLYPKDFIIQLPKPDGYFGAEELFGRVDAARGEIVEGLDVIRNIPDTDLQSLSRGEVPGSLESAIIDFILSGAALLTRLGADVPATMLVHTSRLVIDQAVLASIIKNKFVELREEWRYQRRHGIRERFKSIWEGDFVKTTSAIYPDRVSTFEGIEGNIGRFFEAVQVRTINSSTGDVLDYEREPNIKAIAVGGNRLSRGLTLEGLLVSYFTRRSLMYDTLMQMGRWFGFRRGYDDLTRIHTTDELAGWFCDLAMVEHRLREDIKIYEDQGVTPFEVGMRIWQHPTMQVTSPLKRRFSSQVTLSQSYSLTVVQTYKFPLAQPEELAVISEYNLDLVRRFLGRLGVATWEDRGPYWMDVQVGEVISFLEEFRVHEAVSNISVPLITKYVRDCQERGELTHWTIGVRRRQTLERNLGIADWGVAGGDIFQLSRGRIDHTDSLGVITNPGDESIGLSDEEKERMRVILSANNGMGDSPAARRARIPENGLLLLYPISKRSGHEATTERRRPIFDDPTGPLARDLIGLAISFPESRDAQRIEAYLEGTAGWKVVE